MFLLAFELEARCSCSLLKIEHCFVYAVDNAPSERIKSRQQGRALGPASLVRQIELSAWVVFVCTDFVCV